MRKFCAAIAASVRRIAAPYKFHINKIVQTSRADNISFSKVVMISNITAVDRCRYLYLQIPIRFYLDAWRVYARAISPELGEKCERDSREYDFNNDVLPVVNNVLLNKAAELSEMLAAWAEQSEKYHNGDINRDEYDKWRYNYPKYDETSGFVKVPSQNFSDAMVEAFKDRLKND